MSQKTASQELRPQTLSSCRRPAAQVSGGEHSRCLRRRPPLQEAEQGDQSAHVSQLGQEPISHTPEFIAGPGHVPSIGQSRERLCTPRPPHDTLHGLQNSPDSGCRDGK